MSAGDEIEWTGWGKWLSFAVAAMLLMFSIPVVLLNGAAAGWNIFLALLLFAAVASGHKKAPLAAIILCGLMAIRLVLAFTMGAAVLDIVSDALLVMLTAAAAYDLRRQAASAQGVKTLS
jgi:hypothetical protein